MESRPNPSLSPLLLTSSSEESAHDQSTSTSSNSFLSLPSPLSPEFVPGQSWNWDPSMPIASLHHSQSHGQSNYETPQFQNQLPYSVEAQHLTTPCQSYPCTSCFFPCPMIRGSSGPQTIPLFYPMPLEFTADWLGGPPQFSPMPGIYRGDWQHQENYEHGYDRENEVATNQPQSLFPVFKRARRGGGRKPPRFSEPKISRARSGVILTELNHCQLCRSNRETESVYMGHTLRDEDGKVSCPILRKLVCTICGAYGDNAHTLKYCPLNNHVPLRLRSHNYDKARAASVKMMSMDNADWPALEELVHQEEKESSIEKNDPTFSVIEFDAPKRTAATEATEATEATPAEIIETPEPTSTTLLSFLSEGGANTGFSHITPTITTTTVDSRDASVQTDEDPKSLWMPYVKVRNVAGKYHSLKY